MTQSPPADPLGKNAPLDLATRRILLRLDNAISAFRAGEDTGLLALDSATPLDDVSFRVVGDTLSHSERRRVGRRPDQVELAILTALAETYGSEILSNASLGCALRLLARHSGVVLIQRVLWGDAASDVQLAMVLGATRPAFTQIVFAFSDAFLVEANDVLARFRPQPPGSGKSTRQGGG